MHIWHWIWHPEAHLKYSRAKENCWVVIIFCDLWPDLYPVFDPAWLLTLLYPDPLLLTLACALTLLLHSNLVLLPRFSWLWLVLTMALIFASISSCAPSVCQHYAHIPVWAFTAFQQYPNCPTVLGPTTSLMPLLVLLHSCHCLSSFSKEYWTGDVSEALSTAQALLGTLQKVSSVSGTPYYYTFRV